MLKKFRKKQERFIFNRICWNVKHLIKENEMRLIPSLKIEFDEESQEFILSELVLNPLGYQEYRRYDPEDIRTLEDLEYYISYCEIEALIIQEYKKFLDGLNDKIWSKYEKRK